jgi:2-methylcitrate dehydratase PrpD
LRNFAGRVGGSATASVLGTTMRTSPPLSALINGTSMHADNFDDTSPQPSPDRNGGIHATAGVLPAVLALAEEADLSGRQLTEAFHVGIEVACKLNHAIDQRHYADGFHTTGTLGIFGAAVGAAKLLGLDEDGVAHALALATARAGGVRANFGSMVEQAHSGIAADGGVTAALLAQEGLAGGEDILEARFGWLQAAGGGFAPEAICGRLGAPWAIIDPGTWIKPYPSGSLTHPAMTLLTTMMREHGFDAHTVDKLIVTTNGRMINTLIHHNPSDAMQARFSMQFCLAVLLVVGRAGIAEFTDEVVNHQRGREPAGHQGDDEAHRLPAIRKGGARLFECHKLYRRNTRRRHRAQGSRRFSARQPRRAHDFRRRG